MIQVLVVLHIILESASCSVSNSLWPHGQQPTRLLCPCNSPGKNTGVGWPSFSRGSSSLKDWTQDSCIAGGFFTIWAMREFTICNLETVADCIIFFWACSEKQLLTWKRSWLVQHDIHTSHNLLDEKPKSNTSN